MTRFSQNRIAGIIGVMVIVLWLAGLSILLYSITNTGESQSFACYAATGDVIVEGKGVVEFGPLAGQMNINDNTAIYLPQGASCDLAPIEN